MLILLRPAGSAGFDRGDVAVAREYSLLASHALAGVNARRLIERNKSRAVAAEDANRSKNLFIANMSHELRTPLNAIIGFSEFIGAEAYGPLGSARYAEYVNDIHSSGNHLLGIVNNLLLFSKIEAGQHKVLLDDLSLRDELASVERMLQFDANRHGVQLVCDRLNDGVRVTADQQSLRQVLINVIGNAIKFSPAEEIVRVEHEAGKDGGTHRLRIVDRGCGIPAETLSQLGNPFVQAESAFSRRFQGTGLGLAICFGLTEAMGAAMVVESDEGAGTIVTITLPAAVAVPTGYRLSAAS
jgi:two-component system cell cycle sensor histidine kinase PleC